MKAAFTFCTLVTQKLIRTSKSKDHISCLERRMLLWSDGNLNELILEGRAIQNRLKTSNRASSNNSLSQSFAHKWQMKINVEKCAVLRCTCSLNPIQYTYTLSGHNVDIKKCHTYLGVAINNTMSWSSHIQTVSNRATKVLILLNET